MNRSCSVSDYRQLILKVFNRVGFKPRPLVFEKQPEGYFEARNCSPRVPQVIVDRYMPGCTKFTYDIELCGSPLSMLVSNYVVVDDFNDGLILATNPISLNYGASIERGYKPSNIGIHNIKFIDTLKGVMRGEEFYVIKSCPDGYGVDVCDNLRVLLTFSSKELHIRVRESLDYIVKYVIGQSINPIKLISFCVRRESMGIAVYERDLLDGEVEIIIRGV